MGVLLRKVARVAAEIALVWLVAACTTAAFAPRGTAINAQDQLFIPATTAVGGLLVALPAAGICIGLWWLLVREYLAPLALGAAGVLVVALLLPKGMTAFFLPPPVVLLVAAWILRWVPDRPGEGDRRAG